MSTTHFFPLATYLFFFNLSGSIPRRSRRKTNQIPDTPSACGGVLHFSDHATPDSGIDEMVCAGDGFH